MIKFKTMTDEGMPQSASDAECLTKVHLFVLLLDEIPQLLNVIKGTCRL